MSPEQFRTFLSGEVNKWESIVKESRVTLE